jgi:hypothetical protein
LPAGKQFQLEWKMNECVVLSFKKPQNAAK